MSRLEIINDKLKKMAKEPFGPGSRSFPSYGGSMVFRVGKRFAIATWNHGHGNWTVNDKSGGHGFGPTPLVAAAQCRSVETHTLREIEEMIR